MLDTKARKYVQPLFNKITNGFIRLKISPIQVTFLALVIGLLSPLMLYLDHRFFALALLWLSGLLDVVDGSLARLTGKSSEFGALLDLIFDRIVEIVFIISIALKHMEARMPAICLLSAIIFSFSIFLTVGAVTEKKGEKAFYYQAGLAERTETFIIFSLLILLPHHQIWIMNLFTIMIIYTGIQRFYEAYQLFGKPKSRA